MKTACKVLLVSRHLLWIDIFFVLPFLPGMDAGRLLK
jgi:hypothetical protein